MTADLGTGPSTPRLDPADGLDNPAWSAMTGPHAGLTERHGRAARYLPAVSPFHALADDPGPDAWADLATLVGPGTVAVLAATEADPPDDWDIVSRIVGVQLVDAGLDAAPDPEAVVLGPADVPEMLDLVTATQPGPFAPRTVELGTYLGIRRDGALVAMAGERLRVPGWTEISAVCTAATHQGQGLASRLVRAVAAGISARGDTAFLHAASANTRAIDLYLALGFAHRKTTPFFSVRTPD